MTGKVISWLEQILPAIKRSGDPEGEMLKFAREQNLAPALLEKLAQVFNAAKTLHFLEKSANRGERFHVVDADELVRRYVSDEPAKAATDYTGDWIDRPHTKSAALSTPLLDRWPMATPAPAVELENHLGAKRANVKAILRERSVKQANAETYRQVAFDLGEIARELSVKIAETVRKTPDFDFSTAEADALGLHGARVKSACELVASQLKQLRFPLRRAAAPTAAGVVRDDHGVLGQLAKLATALEQHAAACSLEAEFQKQAASALALPPQPMAQGGTLETTGNKETKPDAGAEAKEEGEETVRESGRPSPKPESGKASRPDGGGILSKLTNVSVPQAPVEPTTMLRSLVQEALPTRNTGQQKVDRDYDDLHSQVVVERLLMTDPILSAADPRVVVSLANSIRDHSPGVARDINAMRFALREAVQYNALPTHTVKDLAGIQKTRDETTETAQGLARERYSQGIKKKEAK